MAVKRKNGIWSFTTAAEATEDVFIKKIRWVNAAGSAGDVLIIDDADGNVLFESVAPTDNWVETFEINRKAAFTIDTISGGNVYLYE